MEIIQLTCSIHFEIANKSLTLSTINILTTSSTVKQFLSCFARSTKENRLQLKNHAISFSVYGEKWQNFFIFWEKNSNFTNEAKERKKQIRTVHVWWIPCEIFHYSFGFLCAVLFFFQYFISQKCIALENHVCNFFLAVRLCGARDTNKKKTQTERNWKWSNSNETRKRKMPIHNVNYEDLEQIRSKKIETKRSEDR